MSVESLQTVKYMDRDGVERQGVIWSKAPGPGRMWVIPGHNKCKYVLVKPIRDLRVQFEEVDS